jgi:hypothetical protein
VRVRRIHVSVQSSLDGSRFPVSGKRDRRERLEIDAAVRVQAVDVSRNVAAVGDAAVRALGADFATAFRQNLDVAAAIEQDQRIARDMQTHRPFGAVATTQQVAQGVSGAADERAGPRGDDFPSSIGAVGEPICAGKQGNLGAVVKLALSQRGGQCAGVVDHARIDRRGQIQKAADWQGRDAFSNVFDLSQLHASKRM